MNCQFYYLKLNPAFSGKKSLIVTLHFYILKKISTIDITLDYIYIFLGLPVEAQIANLPFLCVMIGSQPRVQNVQAQQRERLTPWTRL